MNIVSLSGGKDSTAMLLMMLERGIPVDRVVFADTTKEFPGMYAHMTKLQAMCPVPIETVRLDFDYWFAERVRTKATWRNKAPGYGWPDMRVRWCTALKRTAVVKIEKQCEDAVSFIGIAYDELWRCDNNKLTNKHIKRDNIRYPLVEWKITEADALTYCYSKGLDWGGLYEKFTRVSCYLCPMSRVNDLRTVYNEYPDLWDEMLAMDKKSQRRFQSKLSLSQFTARFEHENIHGRKVNGRWIFTGRKERIRTDALPEVL